MYPIIRRARRPLVIADDDAAPSAGPAPAVPVVGAEEPVRYGKGEAPARKGKHATAKETER